MVPQKHVESRGDSGDHSVFSVMQPRDFDLYCMKTPSLKQKSLHLLVLLLRPLFSPLFHPSCFYFFGGFALVTPEAVGV